MVRGLRPRTEFPGSPTRDGRRERPLNRECRETGPNGAKDKPPMGGDLRIATPKALFYAAGTATTSDARHATPGVSSRSRKPGPPMGGDLRIATPKALFTRPRSPAGTLGRADGQTSHFTAVPAGYNAVRGQRPRTIDDVRCSTFDVRGRVGPLFAPLSCAILLRLTQV